MKKRILFIALFIATLSTVSIVAAEEAGLFTINILNSQDSQLNTNISNSTLHEQTNYTNSQATENVTLTNSTLTLIIDGQNTTINAKDNDQLSVSFIKKQQNSTDLNSQDNASAYQFDVTVNVKSSLNFPFGINATTKTINQALAPLISKYNLQTISLHDSNSNTTNEFVMWTNTYVGDGESIFTLYGNEALNDLQLDSLRVDLFNCIAVAMSGVV